MIEHLAKTPTWFILFVVSCLLSAVGLLLALVLWGIKREIKQFDTSVNRISEKLDLYVGVFTKSMEALKTRVVKVEEHCNPQHETRIAVLENEMERNKAAHTHPNGRWQNPKLTEG